MTKIRSVDAMIADNTIMRGYGGSHAYGTNIATSDVDIRGIFCADKINIQTPFFPVKQSIDMTGDNDITIYELSKFLELYVQGNPNILELLWLDDTSIVDTSPEYDILRNYRYDLLSSKVAFTFTGYAISQIKRIKGHHKWINNPKPVDPPRQTDYVSLVHNYADEKLFKLNIYDFRDDYRLIPYDGNVIGLYPFKGYQTFADSFSLNLVYEKEDDSLFLNDDGTRRLPVAIIKFNKQEYNTAMDDWQNYWSWKKNRNEKRSSLEEQFGYDTKHAMHCIRLCRAGLELLQDGVFNVKRPDAAELLSIRNGAWSYEELLASADHLDNEIRNVWYQKTALPKTPNIKLAAKVLMEVQDSIWSKSK